MAERDEMRKTVTVLFADVVSSTALGERLDPEALRRVMGRYFDEARTAIERHGGTVEKFIGDAVMAVFGVPTLHEDDALRAVRAADDLRSSLAPLNEQLERDSGVTLEIRIGLNTGEVVAGRGETLVTGDAVNVAKRLEEAAGSSEILAGEMTHRLIRDAVEAEPVEPLALKGKAQAVPAFRVLSVREGAPGRERRLDSPMVGREREQHLLEQAYERAVGERACHLFTVLGAAGVGKSRLVAEFLDGLGESATVARGRCLPYGEGITFWPVLEILRRSYGEDVRKKMAADLDDEDAELIAERVAAAVGLTESAGASEETFWAVRKFFEAHAREQPLVIVFDDIHWGEPTFLDLVEHIADWSRDTPILLVSLARPELLDERPGWAGGKFNATSVLLEPLNDDDSKELIDNLLGQADLPPGVRTQVAEAAEGNPLFVEEMLGMLIDDGVLERRNGSWVATGDLSAVSVPPTINALLAARLDRLAPEERSLAERASIEGKVFHRGAVTELSPSETRPGIAGHLQALVRKELVRPDRADLPGEDAFRFRHLLIRDAAYEAMPKELRADLHERFAGWLETTVGEHAPEYEEVLGYHLERAYRYRLELGPPDAEARLLGSRAGERLGSAGERALARVDAPAAISLLERAVELLPAASPSRPRLLCDLGLALTDRGEFERAETVLSEAAVAADAGDDAVVGAVAALRLVWVQLHGGGLMLEGESRVNRLARRFEELGDEDGLAEALLLQGNLLLWKGHFADADECLERAAAIARRVGNHRIESRAFTWLLVNSFWGPMPVSQGLMLCDRVVDEASGNRFVEGSANVIRGALEALAGRWDEGQARTTVGHAVLADLGQAINSAASRMALAWAQIYAGRPQEAERELRTAYDGLSQIGEKGYLSSVAAFLAIANSAQGRYEQADRYAAEALELGAADDLHSQAQRLSAKAEVLASRGDFEQAHAAVNESIEVVEQTDTIGRAAVRVSQSAVFRLEGRPQDARAALEAARRVCEEKEAVSAVAWIEQLAADL